MAWRTPVHVALAAGEPLFYLHLYGFVASMRVSCFGFPASAAILGMALAAMAAQPTDDTLIRICAAVAAITQVVNTVGFGLYPLLAFTGVHSPRYDDTSVGTTIEWLMVSYVVVSLLSVPVFLSILRLRPDAKSTSFSEVKRRVVSKLGPSASIIVVLLLFPVAWAAVQPTSSFRLTDPLAAYHRFWTTGRITVGMWAVFNFIAWCACVIVEAPWKTHPVVPSLLFLTFSQLAVSTTLTSTLVRKRVHAWLSRIGTTTEVRAAAGVSALVGMLRPSKALVLAKERFCALPFDVLAPADLATNQDSGLDRKSVPMKLGQCDAFISHVCAWPRSSRRARCLLVYMCTEEPRALTRCIAVVV